MTNKTQSQLNASEIYSNTIDISTTESKICHLLFVECF